MEIEYNDERHEYRRHGVVLPHVTGILKPLTDYSSIPEGSLRVAREKGIAVHKMIELHAAGRLDVPSLPEWMFPVLDYWLDFCAKSGFQVLESERRVYHPIYSYAGTLDLVGTMRGQTGLGIIDVKRSFFAGAAIGLQTAMYAKAYECETKAPILWRAALALHEDKPYRLEMFRDQNDFSVALAALTIHNWRKKK